MVLKQLSLQHFRNYTKSEFTFDPQTTVIVGNNAIGKTNLLEGLYLVATGKSFKSEKEGQLIQFGKSVTYIKTVLEDADCDDLEVVLSQNTTGYLTRKYLVNGVSKRRVDFASHVQVVLFTPLDLDIVIGQPSARRNFLNEILEQVDMEYRLSMSVYTKALRQRNALLEDVQKTGIRDEERFAYWDQLLIKNGQFITKKRAELIAYINASDKPLFTFHLEYDSSVISEERLAQYRQAEIGAGVTLVGPQRDDVFITTTIRTMPTSQPVKHFCSRGQQRLVTLELKKIQISYMKERTLMQPVLLLDDIFSELDNNHIGHVLELIGKNQTILTTTHKEFVSESLLTKPLVIELKDNR